MKTHTLRGHLEGPVGPDPEVYRLVVDDGRLNHGYRIKSFTIWRNNIGSANDVQAILGTTEDCASGLGVTFAMNASDNSQLAWALWDGNTTQAQWGWSLVDPDHIVQQDMFIAITAPTNYLIEMEAVELNEAATVLQLVKSKQR